MGRPTAAKQGNVRQSERIIEAWNLKLEGLTEQQIGERFNVHRSTISRWLRQAFQVRAEPVAAELVAVELDKLDKLEQAARGVLNREHLTVSRGQVVERWDDQLGRDVPILDDAPVLRAIDTILKVCTRRAALLGLDAAMKIDASVNAPEIPKALSDRIAAARAAAEKARQQVCDDEEAAE